MSETSIAEFDRTVISPTAEDLSGMLSVVFSRWNEVRGADWAPTWFGFSLENLPPKVIPWCVAVNVEHDPEDFVYRFWGTERARLQGQELTGRSVSEFEPASMSRTLRQEYAQVVETRSVFLIRKRHTTLSGLALGFESLRLPLSDGDADTAVILSIARSETLTRENYRYFGTEPPLSLSGRGGN